MTTLKQQNDQLNQLHSELLSWVLHICTDLFMVGAGPNVRAKLCHGELQLVHTCFLTK